jgi:hypothetical protein
MGSLPKQVDSTFLMVDKKHRHAVMQIGGRLRSRRSRSHKKKTGQPGRGVCRGSFKAFDFEQKNGLSICSRLSYQKQNELLVCLYSIFRFIM